jgi:hypothetical protein
MIKKHSFLRGNTPELSSETGPRECDFSEAFHLRLEIRIFSEKEFFEKKKSYPRNRPWRPIGL